jgi:hypothetical protein
MARLDPRSPDAIRIYILLAGAVVGFLLAFFLIVPILQSSCTWFTSRCTQVTVQRGADNALLVTVGPYQYFYDGKNYIYAYGDSLAGECPAQVVSGVLPLPVISPPLANFCFRWRPTPDDPACQAGDDSKCAVCDQMVQQVCARAAAEVAPSTGKYSCDGGKTVVPAGTCCDTIPPCVDPKQQCMLTAPATQQADGSFTCAQGKLDGEVCDLAPQYVAGKGYTCNSGTSYTPSPQCCLCSSSFTQVTHPGTTDALNLFEPVFVVDAKAMRLLPTNRGIMCGVRQEVVAQQFVQSKRERVNVNVPVAESGLDIYQVFDVLKKKQVFHTT